jgi:hypothetical protein
MLVSKFLSGAAVGVAEAELLERAGNRSGRQPFYDHNCF